MLSFRILLHVFQRQTSNIKNLSLNKKEHLDKLKRLIPKSYNFKNENKTTFGLIAQEVEKIYPSI